MKTTEKIAFAAIAFGIAVAAGLYWLSEGDGPWWGYGLAIWIVAGLAYGAWIKIAADENLANRKD